MGGLYDGVIEWLEDQFPGCSIQEHNRSLWVPPPLRNPGRRAADLRINDLRVDFSVTDKRFELGIAAGQSGLKVDLDDPNSLDLIEAKIKSMIEAHPLMVKRQKQFQRNRELRQEREWQRSLAGRS
jgi:hypothetical protein